MNIEQEFKELHELLLCAYDEDYEESLDKALSKLDNLKKQLLLHNVSQQRELLLDFLSKVNGNLIAHPHLQMNSDFVDDYLKSNNCG